MGMEGSGLSVADALALQDRGTNDNMFGGNGAWVFFLFFLLAWGGNGFWGNRGNTDLQGALTRADLCQDMNFQSLENSVRGIQSGICDGFYAMNTTALQGFNGISRDVAQGFANTNAGITDLGYQMKTCCCETNRNIDAVRYENAQNTCAITNAIHAEGEQTRSLIQANEIQALRDKVADLQLAQSQCAQNAYLVDKLQPVARPAYITCSPYAVNACGYGCGNYSM